MRLRKIILRDFKRFDDLTIDLGDNPKKVIALVGPNGCGKSSIFDSFDEKQRDYKGSSYSPPFHYLFKKIFKIDFNSESYQRASAVQIIKSDNTSTFDKKSFYIRTSYRFTPNIQVNEIRKQEDILDDRNRPGSSSQLDRRLQENYERLLGQGFSEWQDGDKSGKQWRLEKLGVVNSILRNVVDIQITSLGDVVSGKGQMYFQKGNSKNFPYENLSSGEKEVVDLLLDLVVKTTDYNDTVFCIDEPELHLNTKIQRQLLVEIEKLIPDSCQLWIATHSLGFLRAMQEDLKQKIQIINMSDVDFDSPIVLVPMKPTRNNWQKIFQTALEDITGLVSPKTIIYCEGRKEPGKNGEELGLDAEVYNLIFSEKYPDCLFVSSGGNTELEKNSSIALLVLSKAFKDVSLVLLKDRDIHDDDTPTSLEERDSWLLSRPNAKMLIRKEMENYLFDLEIIEKIKPDIDKDIYQELIKDITDEDIKAKSGKLLELCGLNNLMNITKFKLELAKLITEDTIVYKELESAIFPIKIAEPAHQ